MVLLAKTKLNSIDVLIYKALIDSNITHDAFVLVNNVLNEYDTKKEFKHFKIKQFIKDFDLFIKRCSPIVWNVEQIKKAKTQGLKIQKEENECFYQNFQLMAVKNLDLLKSKKLADYYKDLLHL